MDEQLTQAQMDAGFPMQEPATTTVEPQKTTENVAVPNQVVPEGNPSEVPMAQPIQTEVPFNENPVFQERIKEIEQKHGTDAKQWQVVKELANKDPQFAVSLIQKMEENGYAPAGTTEEAKRRLGLQQNLNNQQTQPQQQVVQPQAQPQLPETPEVKFIRQMMAQQQEQQAKQEAVLESTVTAFEKERPEIAGNREAKPILWQNAQYIMRTEGVSDLKAALHLAADRLLNVNKLTEDARKNGEVQGYVRGISEVGAAATPNGGATTNTSYSQEEIENAKIIGATPQEYRDLQSGKSFDDLIVIKK